MRILFIGSRGSNHTKKWTDAFIERGHVVMVVCRKEEKQTSVVLDPKVKLHVMRFGGPQSYILNIPELRKLYNEFKPDVVNVHYMAGYGLMATLAGLRPLVLNCYGSDIFVAPQRSKINRWIIKQILNRADAVAATSIAMATEAQRIMGNNEKKVAVTPFGVNVKLFCPSDNKVKHERPVITIVKYLQPIYDIELLIRAFAIAYDMLEVKPILRIYGSGPLKEELVALSNELGKADSISFYETIPNTQVPDVIRESDVFVNCSKIESFGVTVVEGMACGVPVVVTDCPGPREVVDDEETGIILKDRKPVTMANALVRLLNDDSLRERMGKAGRKKVLDNYNWDNNVILLENVYKEVIRK